MENKSLVLDLLQWVAAGPRTYADVMSAWRTSCPRLSIWEDTVEAGFVGIEVGDNSKRMVHVTTRGLGFLEANRPSEADSATDAAVVDVPAGQQP